MGRVAEAVVAVAGGVDGEGGDGAVDLEGDPAGAVDQREVSERVVVEPQRQGGGVLRAGGAELGRLGGGWRHLGFLRAAHPGNAAPAGGAADREVDEDVAVETPRGQRAHPLVAGPAAGFSREGAARAAEAHDLAAGAVDRGDDLRQAVGEIEVESAESGRRGGQEAARRGSEAAAAVAGVENQPGLVAARLHQVGAAIGVEVAGGQEIRRRAGGRPHRLRVERRHLAAAQRLAPRGPGREMRVQRGELAAEHRHRAALSRAVGDRQVRNAVAVEIRRRDRGRPALRDDLRRGIRRRNTRREFPQRHRAARRRRQQSQHQQSRHDPLHIEHSRPPQLPR